MGVNELLEVLDAEANGGADADGLELTTTHEVVDRRAAETEHLAGLLHGDKQRRRRGRSAITDGIGGGFG